MDAIFSEIDYQHMSLALNLAERAAGLNHPNPLVGSVCAIGEHVVGQSFHDYEKTWHAEKLAIDEAGELAKGATLYVNLEPCAHRGRTPPCVESIIQAGIRRVVFSINDPDPRVNGKGEKALADAGVKVDKGLMSETASELNRDYIKVKTTGLPWILVKVAISLDGKIGFRGKKGAIFSSRESLKLVHRIRAWCDAIMVGANTIRVDDPLLTCRIDEFESVDISESREIIYPLPSSSRNPVRVTLSRNLNIPLTSRILDISDARTVVFCGEETDARKIREFELMGVTVKPVRLVHDKMDLKEILKQLVEMNIMSVMVEGGGDIIGNLIYEKLVDEFYISIAPVLIGDDSAINWLGRRLADSFVNAPRLNKLQVFKVGEDCLIRGRRSDNKLV